MYSEYPGPEETKIFSTMVCISRLIINVLAHSENGDYTAGRINDCSISLRISYSEILESILYAWSIASDDPRTWRP